MAVALEILGALKTGRLSERGPFPWPALIMSHGSIHHVIRGHNHRAPLGRISVAIPVSTG